MTPSPYRQPGRPSPNARPADANVRPPLVAVLALVSAVALVSVPSHAAERDREKAAGGIVSHFTIVDVLLKTNPR